MQCTTAIPVITTAAGSPDRAAAPPPPREVAPFLKSLRRMLQDESDAVLRWTPDGRAFEIHDMDEMMARVLPKYFKHCKYTSFQRQLNYFNFRKWTKSKAVVCTFSNDFFLRDQPELAWRITRKKSLSPHAHAKYRAARAAAVPYWKREHGGAVLPAAVAAFDGVQMLLPDSRCRLPFPPMSVDAADLMLKQHDVRLAQPSRRCYSSSSFNMADPYATATTRGYDAPNSGGGEQTEPLDWIDCLLPPATDDSYLCMYPPAATVAVSPINMRKSFEFVPTSL
ncbi:HSF-type DNA-binding protein [Phytophthora cinnamomi]|uniref:HSF-type DNA-binding protein n=1 Tax=Phytophthora cinnamomi TaxID=4785 RepID=UPI00355A7990|nr:HSF-type DNA-binding protein [Phytophthora cinnamomi]